MTTPGMTTARSYPEVVPDNCSRGHSALTFCGAMNNGTAERAQLCRCFAADYELFIERSPAAALRQLRDRMRIPGRGLSAGNRRRSPFGPRETPRGHRDEWGGDPPGQ